MDANTLRIAMAGMAVLLSRHGVYAADPPRAAAPVAAASAAASASVPASAASAAASSRGGSPRPYQAPMRVPSAAGQIPSLTLPTPAIIVTPAARPTFSGTCDSSGCWGSDGTRYNAIGGALVRPDGRMCQRVGGVMQCP